MSKQLSAEFGDGYSVPNLSRMTRFVEVFADRAIVLILALPAPWLLGS